VIVTTCLLARSRPRRVIREQLQPSRSLPLPPMLPALLYPSALSLQPSALSPRPSGFCHHPLERSRDQARHQPIPAEEIIGGRHANDFLLTRIDGPLLRHGRKIRIAGRHTIWFRPIQALLVPHTRSH
jgi:hypothetical protein